MFPFCVSVPSLEQVVVLIAVQHDVKKKCNVSKKSLEHMYFYSCDFAVRGPSHFTPMKIKFRKSE